MLVSFALGHTVLNPRRMCSGNAAVETAYKHAFVQRMKHLL